MTEAIQLAEVEFASVRVTERTTWTFAELSDREGRTSLVEVTCGDETPDAVAALAEYVAVLKGRDIPDESGVAGSLRLNVSAIQARRPLASAVSALRTAIVVLQAQSNRYQPHGAAWRHRTRTASSCTRTSTDRWGRASGLPATSPRRPNGPSPTALPW